MNKGGTQTNGSKNKKIDNDKQGFNPRDDEDRFYVWRKGVGRGLTSTDDCVDAKKFELEQYAKKSKERLITAASIRNISLHNSCTNSKKKKKKKKKKKNKI